MPAFCCVVNCGSSAQRDKVRFFRIPNIRHFTHKHRLNELSQIRRQKWIDAIKREDLTEIKLKYATVCSRHFIAGEPAKLEDDLHPDWIPSLNMGYNKLGASSSTKLSRFGRSRSNKRLKLNVEASVEEVCEVSNLEDPSEEPIDRAEAVVCSNNEVQTDLNMTDLSLLFVKLSTMSDDLKRFQERIICCTNLKSDDSKTKYYTGLANYKVFEIVVKYIKPFIKIHGKNSLEPQEQILLTLVKLRLNSDFKDIAYRFGISPSTASTYFKNVIRIMYLRFKTLIIWPERSVLLKNMPQCFIESFHDKTTVIIDCFEIRCETPSDLLLAAQAWSNYKHSETIKYLIGITPQGSISFISEGWGGRVSDKCLTQNSKFLDNLCPGDVVLADRGFLIKEFVDLFHATVKIPAFTRGKSQLHPVDLEKTRAIAHVRIHVERVIGMIRQKYKIIYGPISVTLLSTRGDEALLDEIVTVCCSLVNLCPAIVPL